MRFARFAQRFSSNSSLKVKVGPHSELSRYLRVQKTPAELSWQRKMRREWVLITIATVIIFNITYNSFPEIWLSHNLFMPTTHSLVVQAKREAEAEYEETLRANTSGES